MSKSDDPLASAVVRACAGDAAAVEELVVSVQDPIYALGIRMLWDPEEARDATQEILVKIVTHLASYRGESRFSTWCFAIAANYLRTAKRSRIEAAEYTFESFEAELHAPATASDSLLSHPEYAVAVEEVRIGCTLGMLTCLGREERLAYIIGEILEFDHNEGAAIVGVSPAAFRQRLSRARKAIIEFTRRVCGIVDSNNQCSCRGRTGYAVATGRVQLGERRFQSGMSGPDHETVKHEVQRLKSVRRAVALYRSQPPFVAPEDLRQKIAQLISRGERAAGATPA